MERQDLVMIMEDHKTIWTKNEIQKARQRNLYIITIGVFVVLFSVFLWLIHASYIENQQMARDRTRKILSTYAYNLQQQLKKGEEVSEVMKGVVISYQGLPQHFDEVARPLYYRQRWVNNIDLAPGGNVTMIYPESERKYTTVHLFEDPMTAATARLSRDKGIVVAKGPYILDNTYRQGIVLRNPVYLTDEEGNSTFWGFADVNINLNQIVMPIMNSLDGNGYNYMLYKQMSPLSNDIRLISHSKLFPREPLAVTFTWASCRWELSIEPKDGWTISPFTKALGVTGLVIVVLITLLVNMMLRLRLRNRHIQQIAREDKLTGLYNRWGFNHAVSQYVKQHRKRPMALAMMDVDNFKFFNDRYGHDIGDQVLKDLARQMQSRLGKDAILGRSGGDEFIAIIPLKASGDAEGLFRRFVEGAHELTYKERQFHYTVSLGYALYPDQSTNHKELYRFADMALYAVKVRGGNGCLGYESYMNVVERPQLGFTLKDITDNIPLPLLIMQETEGEPLHLLFASKKALEFFGCPSLESLVQFAGGDMNALISSQDTKRIQSDEENRQYVKIMTQLGAKDTALITRKTHSIYHGDICYIILIDRNKEIK